jgi:fructokinase
MTRGGNVSIGIDLGGTKVEVIALDGHGHALLRRRVPTPRGDYERTLEVIAALVRAVETEVRPARATVGIGTPGTYSRATGRMRNCNSTWLNGRPLIQDLERQLERPVAVANDANCFALSEATDGAAEGADVVFAVILGTGVGAGLVVGGRVLVGPNGIAGEWGHNPLPWPTDDERPGEACYCGKSGCIETFLSGPGFAKDHASASGEDVGSEGVVRRAAEGDPRAIAACERYEQRLARALAHVVNIVDPDVVVLGGGMSNLPALQEGVARRWSEWIFSDRVDTRLVRALHGDSSGVRGAAWLGAQATGDGPSVR